MESKSNSFLFSFMTFLNTCFHWKKALIFTVLITAILTSVIMLIVPKTFTSYAQIFPTRGQQIQGMNSNIGSFIASGLLGSTDSDVGLLASLLQSNALLNHLIDKFDLFNIYNQELRQEIRRALQKDFSVSLTDNGAFLIELRQKTSWLSSKDESDITRKRSQEMLSEVISFIDEKNVELKTQSARYQREFLEKKFNEESQRFNNLQDSLVKFQNEFGVFSYEDQVRSAVSLIIEMKSQILTNEAEIYSLERISPKSSVLDELRIKNNAVKEQLKKIERRDVDGISDMLIPDLKETPKISVQQQRFIYEIVMRYELLKFVGSQLEQARIQEAKDTPTIQIIDEPSYPEKRTFPQRTKTVLIAMIAVFLLTILIINMIETITQHSRKDVDFAGEYSLLKTHFRNIFKFK